MQRAYRHGGRHLSVTVERSAPDRWRVVIDGREHEVEAALIDPSTLQLVVGGVSHLVHVVRIGEAEHVACQGAVYVLAPEASGGLGDDHAPALAPPQIVAPMPGKVLQVLVTPGQHVAAGDGLLILEAMKMEHRMVAEAAAVVKAVHATDGQMVDAGAVLVELDYSER